MKTAASITSVKITTTLEIVGKDTLRHPLNMGESTKIIANAGEKYRIVKKHNANDVLADDVVVTKSGDNLEISYADDTHVTLEGFYSADAQLELPANDGGIHTVTSNSESLSTNESNYVYAHGNHDTLMSMTQNNQALQVAVADRISVSDLPHYAELATGVATGVATDAVIGSAAAGTTAATSTAAVAAGTAATTGLSTMAMVGIGAVGVGGGAMVLSGGSNRDTTVPVTPVTPTPTDNTPPATIAPAGFVFTDAGRSATDALSSNPTITLSLASDTATWQYSLDNGTTWSAGTGDTITLAEGTYDKQDVQVKQFDAAGNSSISHMSTTATLESSAMVQLEAIGVTNGSDGYAQTTAVGTSGAYVTVFSGTSASMYQDDSVYVQKFNADGTISGDMVELQAIGVMGLGDYGPQVTAVGTSGEYVVTFNGYDNGARFIYVQKFNADGTIANNTMVKLEVAGVATNENNDSQITSVGTDGSFVVTFLGKDTSVGHDYSIFVQKFNADGTTTNNAMVQLEAMGNFTGGDYSPQITAVGATGEYVVTFHGQDTGVAGNDTSVFVQKFNADGTIMGNAPVRLEAIGNATGGDDSAQVTALGATGEFVVTFEGQDTDNDYSIFVQKFNADGTPSGAMVQLEAIGNTTGDDYNPQITAVGTAGQFVVTFEGNDADNNYTVFVQKCNTDGTTTGAMVELLVPGVTWIGNNNPQITALGNAGEFAVTFYGRDTNQNYSIFVQKFDANGASIGGMVQLDVANADYDNNQTPQITAVGTTGEFVVTFQGIDSTGNWSVFVQKFNANGTVVDLSNAMVIDTTAPSVAITSVASTNDDTPTISGTAEVGSTVTVVVAGATYSVKPAPDGSWSVTLGGNYATNITSGTLAVNINGNNSVSVTATDTAGNVSTATTQTLHIDTTPPALIAHAAFVLSDTGLSTTDGVTSDNTMSITLASDTSSWKYSLDSGATWTDGTGTSFVLPDASYSVENIVVKQFDAVGNNSVSTMGSMVQLEATGVSKGSDGTSQITAVGTTGEYVVTFHGTDSNGDGSIFVQKFSANGTATGDMVQLEAIGVTNGNDADAQITALGTDGAFAVTFWGYDADGSDYSVYVQKFNADGTTTNNAMVKLEATGVTTMNDSSSQITSVGIAGAYVVTFQGEDINGEGSIYVQKFDASGVVSGDMVKLEATGVTYGEDLPHITSLGTIGEYAVTFAGYDADWYHYTFVQKFNADGTTTGNTMVTLNTIYDGSPQITAVGTAREFVVAYLNDMSGIDIQKFNADGTTSGSVITCKPMDVNYVDSTPEITAVGTAGDFVVTFKGIENGTYESYTYIQKYAGDGTPSTVIKLVALPESQNPHITSIGTDGSFVVTTEANDNNGQHFIYVQKYDGSSNPVGETVKIGATSMTTNVWNSGADVTAVGNDGGYAVTFEGRDSAGDYSIFVQKFNADGTLALNTDYGTIVVDAVAPIFSSLSTANVHDNITTSTVVYDAQTTEGDTGMSYSISGADMSLFALNATTGAVTFVTAPNVTTPTDTGANNVYDFTITATDLVGNTADQAVALGVTHDFTGTTVTSNGVTFILGAESVQNGKSYYFITNVNGTQYPNHDVLDTAFNGGSDTVDTTVTAGVDDARTFVSAGVTYVLPTATELLALSPSTPGGWYLSASQTSAENHSHVLIYAQSSQSMGDFQGDFLMLQVLPA